MPPNTALSAFGFTDLESSLYTELLRQAPATGYRLSQRVGKAPANVYQALKVMEQKGVLLASNSSDPVTYTPIPPAELFASLRRDFDRRHTEALSSLSAVYQPTRAEEFFQLRSVAHVVERVRAMIAEAREIVLFDLFPAVFDLFAEDMEAARARGVTVAGIAYREEHAGPTVPFNREAASFVGEGWPGVGVLVVADGAQQLMAQLSLDMEHVLNGLWSDSIFQSCFLHSYVAAHIRLVAFRADPSDPLRELSLQQAQPPGLQMLMAQREGNAG
ncbi:helix-turn-helix domain-containing protein [Sphingomonas sp. LR60]|uniref:TrmB family transcriptional regulator n=1 Tax=Sphingomonas sp. LR60 TaxID=3050233 RepID=UPI002FE0870A